MEAIDERHTYRVEHIRLGDVRVGDVVLMPSKRGGPSAWRTVRCVNKGDKFTAVWDNENGAADASRGSHIHWMLSAYNETLIEVQVANG